MNATKQGLSAGQSTRRVANVATHATYEGGKTVATAVGGFFRGFFGTQDSAPADVVEAPVTSSIIHVVKY